MSVASLNPGLSGSADKEPTMTLRARMTAFAASAALAVAGAAPAQADPDARDIISLLAGLAALGIIANAGNGHPAPQPYHPAPQPHHPAPPTYHPAPPPVVYNLPGKCLVKVQTKFGWERAYDSDCLWRAGYHRALPQQCARGGRNGNHWTQVYAEYCLRQHGY